MRGTSLGVGLQLGALEQEVADETCPYFRVYRALLPRYHPLQLPESGNSGSDLPRSGAGAGLGVSASALITSVVGVGEEASVAVAGSEPLRLPQLESPLLSCPLGGWTGGTEMHRQRLGTKSVLSLVLCTVIGGQGGGPLALLDQSKQCGEGVSTKRERGKWCNG